MKLTVHQQSNIQHP